MFKDFCEFCPYYYEGVGCVGECEMNKDIRRDI